jgi:dUTP pyrophosphatase
MTVKIKKLYEDAIIPTHGSEYAAGYDLYAHIEGEGDAVGCYIPPHKCVLIGTGVAVQPPVGYFGAVFARSGLASKQGLRPANCVGVCDYDYTGEYIIALHNDSNEPKTVLKGDRIGQVVFIPYIDTQIIEVAELDETKRGDGGFGSTGV